MVKGLNWSFRPAPTKKPDGGKSKLDLQKHAGPKGLNQNMEIEATLG